MTADVPDRVAAAFERNDAVERTDAVYAITSTVFDSSVTASEGPGENCTYTVTVFVPTLAAATADQVGDAVADGWRATLVRRLEDAPKATRAGVELADFEVETREDELLVTYSYHWGDPDSATAIAKTFVEYVEGTYVEGIVPGYEYESPVADLLADASQTGSSGTPL